MARILSIANKVLSLRGRILITNEDDAVVYAARGELAFFQSWRLYLGDDDERAPCARIRRRVLSWAPTWDIQGDGAPFQIKKKLWSWTRQYYVVGGPYDGATVKGKLWDLSFSVAHHGDVLATSAGKLLSLRDRHRVDIRREEDELFIVIAMLVLQIDRRTEASQSGD